MLPMPSGTEFKALVETKKPHDCLVLFRQILAVRGHFKATGEPFSLPVAAFAEFQMVNGRSDRRYYAALIDCLCRCGLLIRFSEKREHDNRGRMAPAKFLFGVEDRESVDVKVVSLAARRNCRVMIPAGGR